MFLATLLTTLAHSAPVEASWRLDTGEAHRWHVETAIDFPGHIFVMADRNVDVRAKHLGLEAVVDCEVAESSGKDGILHCVVEDAAWAGTTFATEHGRLQAVLEEFDAKLTGATVSLRLTDDGRLRSVDVALNRLVPFENRRTRRMDAFLRMVVVRALAPLELEIPRGGFPTTEPWVRAPGLASAMPVTWGSSGRGQMVHTATPHDDTRVVVQSVGRATMIPGGFMAPGTLILDAELQGFTVFDHQAGRVSEALWATRATPTATSGPMARPYGVRNRVRALEREEVVLLKPTRELTPPDA